MDAKPTNEALDPELGFPTDPAVERQRLIDDAKARGVDPEEALHVAEELATSPEPRPDDYRAVDRRLASGYDIEETRRILVERDMSPTSEHGPHAHDQDHEHHHAGNHDHEHEYQDAVDNAAAHVADRPDAGSSPV